MRRGQKSQSRVRHQRSVGRYHSPYQVGGTIVRTPFNPWNFTSSYKPYGLDPMILRSLNQRANRRASKEKGGKVTYPWMLKGRKRIKRRRKQR